MGRKGQSLESSLRRHTMFYLGKSSLIRYNRRSDCVVTDK
jgi:hypothetical protein